VRASVNRMADVAGLYKIPFLTFTVQSVNMLRTHSSELRASITRAM